MRNLWVMHGFDCFSSFVFLSSYIVESLMRKNFIAFVTPSLFQFPILINFFRITCKCANFIYIKAVGVIYIGYSDCL